VSHVNDLCALAGRVDTCAICDVDKQTRVMSAALRCRSANPNLCGPALTVRCREDFFGLVLAIEQARPGDVIVVDGGGSRTALAGELFARAALARGIAGIIVRGPCRGRACRGQRPARLSQRGRTRRTSGGGPTFHSALHRM